MRIAVCAAFYHPFRGGYVESLHGLLERLAARGHDITVIACDTHGARPEEVINGVRVVRIPAWNPYFLNGSFPIPHLWRAWRALRRAQARGIDVLSTQTRFFPITFIGFLFGKCYGIPLVHVERGARHAISRLPAVRCAGMAIDHTFGRLVCRYSNAVVGVSQAACDFARRLGARAPRVIYNGIDAAYWRRPRDFAPVSGRLVFVGRLIEAKGVQDLLRVLPALASDAPDIHAVIAGDGPYRPALEALARELSITDRVRFVGELNTSSVRELLWSGAVFVNPSYSEGLPRSVLEAAAVGMPVVATDVGGTREIMRGAPGLFLYPYGNLQRFYQCLRIGLDHISTITPADFLASRFLWSASVRAYESLFQDICAA